MMTVLVIVLKGATSKQKIYEKLHILLFGVFFLRQLHENKKRAK